MYPTYATHANYKIANRMSLGRTGPKKNIRPIIKDDYGFRWPLTGPHDLSHNLHVYETIREDNFHLTVRSWTLYFV
jgi:hypothetical protein